MVDLLEPVISYETLTTSLDEVLENAIVDLLVDLFKESQHLTRFYLLIIVRFSESSLVNTYQCYAKKKGATK